MWAFLPPLLLRERDHYSIGGQDLHLGEDPAGYIIKTPSWVAPFKTSSWRWTLPCIFPFVVHLPCGSCVFDCLVDVWLDLFLSVSPCDFSPFFLVFIMFFEGIHSTCERSAYTGFAPYHGIMSHVDHVFGAPTPWFLAWFCWFRPKSENPHQK